MTFAVNYGDGLDWSHVQSASFSGWHNFSSIVVNDICPNDGAVL